MCCEHVPAFFFKCCEGHDFLTLLYALFYFFNPRIKEVPNFTVQVRFLYSVSPISFQFAPVLVKPSLLNRFFFCAIAEKLNKKFLFIPCIFAMQCY